MVNVNLKKKNSEKLSKVIGLLNEVKNDDWLMDVDLEKIEEIKGKIEELKLVIK